MTFVWWARHHSEAGTKPGSRGGFIFGEIWMIEDIEIFLRYQDIKIRE
jgi:hypothetical protein